MCVAMQVRQGAADVSAPPPEAARASKCIVGCGIAFGLLLPQPLHRGLRGSGPEEHDVELAKFASELVETGDVVLIGVGRDDDSDRSFRRHLRPHPRGCRLSPLA